MKFWPFHPEQELECGVCGRRFPYFTRVRRDKGPRGLRQWVYNRANAERHERACKRKEAAYQATPGGKDENQ